MLNRIFTLLLFCTAFHANSALMLTIQPSTDNSTTYYTITWDSLSGSNFIGNSIWNVSNPMTGANSGFTSGVFYNWENVGNFMTSTLNEYWIRPLSPSYSSTTNNVGFYLDDDPTPDNDDFGLVFDVNVLNSGSLVIAADTIGTGFNSLWNVGTYTDNPDVTIVVTNEAFQANPVSTPNAISLLLVSLIALFTRARVLHMRSRSI